MGSQRIHPHIRPRFFFGLRRVSRRSRVSVVSLEIPGIVVSLGIPVFRIFPRKKSGKIVKIVFSDSQQQNKILNFLSFYTTSISYINRFFRAPSPLKPLYSSPRYQNLPGEPLTAHPDHQRPLSDLAYLKKLFFFDFCFAFFDLCSPYVTLP